jgi:hypothetical protein
MVRLLVIDSPQLLVSDIPFPRDADSSKFNRFKRRICGISNESQVDVIVVFHPTKVASFKVA